VNECKPLPVGAPAAALVRHLRRRLCVAAQVEFESKIEAKLKALYHILVSSP
jgi:hypothetical protein